ncbi:MAG TPA: CidA/LrgA family protein [Longimicrobiaceae bacterium]|nr:CidA/LrgA family protein [Longimicrobiaceae bacterium]
MLYALATLLVFQLIGELISYLLNLPVPGPVIGMALLFLTMVAVPAVGEKLRETASGLLQHLSLLFVPAGVGVMLHAQRLAADWVPISVALTLGTATTLAVTALVIKLIGRRYEPDLGERP